MTVILKLSNKITQILLIERMEKRRKYMRFVKISVMKNKLLNNYH